MTDDDDDRPPWHLKDADRLNAPGRRLDKAKRSAPWSASGVDGVRPLGTQDPRTSVTSDWANRKHRSSRKAPGEGRPTTGFQPDRTKSLEPDLTLSELLEALRLWFSENQPEAIAVEYMSELIAKSHAPFEIVVAWEILGVLLNAPDAQGAGRPELRSLARGEKVYWNLAGRLGLPVEIPAGVRLQHLDPLFYDLPSTALQLPAEFMLVAFLRVAELLRGPPPFERAICEYRRKLYARFIEGRAFGHHPMTTLFPFRELDWAPPLDDDEDQ